MDGDDSSCLQHYSRQYKRANYTETFEKDLSDFELSEIRYLYRCRACLEQQCENSMTGENAARIISLQLGQLKSSRGFLKEWALDLFLEQTRPMISAS
ncbi:hypothetical protein MASR2M70_01410 [Bacillota bacterium]